MLPKWNLPFDLLLLYINCREGAPWWLYGRIALLIFEFDVACGGVFAGIGPFDRLAALFSLRLIP